VTLSGIGGDETLNSDQALSLENLPRSMVIIGGGYIGLEFAQIFHALGSKVTVLEMLSQLLPNEDADVAKELEGSLKKEGIQIFTKATVKEISGSDAHKVVRYTIHDQQISLKADCVLMAAGRRPYTEGLGLESVGVKTEQGRIVVNNDMQTTTTGIYAIGDVIGGMMLAHVATAEGRVAAEHIMGEGRPMDYTSVPRCIYTSPEAASVGLTEAEAKKKYGEIRVGRFPLSGLGKAHIVGGFGFAKIISEKKFSRILGVHLVGPHVTELIAEAAVAMNLECTSEEMAYTIHPHPTISEAMMEAAMSLMNP
jgi:dihydrolipoamide dehydrogenase